MRRISIGKKVGHGICVDGIEEWGFNITVGTKRYAAVIYKEPHYGYRRCGICTKKGENVKFSKAVKEVIRKKLVKIIKEGKDKW